MNPPDDIRRGLLRLIPQVNELVDSVVSSLQAGEIPRQVVTRAARNVLEDTRQQILGGESDLSADDLSLESLTALVASESALLMRPSLRKVINATGVVLHTNLGRSVLSRAALDAVQTAAEGYCNLEYNIESGRRGSRQEHLEDLLCWLTGSEAAFAVNNNAAAVLLVLAALARGREVIVSRGQLVEIGDSFRLPDIMHQSGARLVEVGTTNRTKASDYLNAVGPDTGMIMLIHQSNFRIVGYTEDVPLAQLVEIGRQHFVPVVEDMGSGCLVDLEGAGLGGEHTAAASIEAGADLVTFSGDKLLGGPQGGIIVGSREYVDAVRKHPLARALRLDKLSLAALEATLRSYVEPRAAWSEIPALRMLSEPPEAVKARANKLKRSVDKACIAGLTCEVIPEISCAGGGSLPMAEIPTFCLRLTHASLPAEALEESLRKGEPAVLARVKGDSVLLDLRTVSDRDVPPLGRALAALD
ncbi:MAG: L-seryl-tRNA(Sec) selenium transferase [Candidatus Geothermincolia bacterium]